jgi:hypothetical protein
VEALGRARSQRVDRKETCPDVFSDRQARVEDGYFIRRNS